MDISDAQRDVRTTFVGGYFGQLVSAAVWLGSSAAWTWRSPRSGVLVLLVGGVLIFPLTLAALRLSGRRPGLPPGHPMNALGTQVALALPLGLPVALGAALARPEWLYPAVTILLGAHYLPFAFLYGMRMFVALSGVLVGGGVWMGVTADPERPVLAGWATGVVLVVFAVLGRASTAGEADPVSGPGDYGGTSRRS